MPDSGRSGQSEFHKPMSHCERDGVGRLQGHWPCGGSPHDRAALSEDPRVVAAANIDGTPYGDLPDRKLTRPFLLLQSDYAETHHGDCSTRATASCSPHDRARVPL